MIHDPGWLMRVCEEAHISVMLNHNPSQYIPINIPISDHEAKELYVMMSKRFKAWTGKSLIEYKKD